MSIMTGKCNLMVVTLIPRKGVCLFWGRWGQGVGVFFSTGRLL